MRLQPLLASSFPLPASRSAIRIRFHGFDFVWALVTPGLAFYLSDAYRLNGNQADKTILIYLSVTFLASVLSLLFFRVHDGVESYFSVHDALVVLKAVLVSEFVTCVVLFVATRLEGIPRSMPIIHGLLFVAGIALARMATRASAAAAPAAHVASSTREHVVLIGANNFSALYIKFLKMSESASHDVVAILDSQSELFGRAIEGVRVVGAPEHLECLIAEYAIHGIEISRIVVAGEPRSLSPEQLYEITTISEKHQIFLDFMPRLLGFRDTRSSGPKTVIEARALASITPPAYLRWKRGLDFVLALVMLIILLPPMVVVGLCVLVDLGSPVLFWQQRLGMNGSRFLLYKFRTLRAPFDWRGNPIPPEQRLSRIGRALRDTSLDELPQLLNILVGNMSLIGPRPLLPEDQPQNPAIRLSVRPGISGWAQVNGGKRLTPQEKDELDEWYVKNASLWVDLKIVLKTTQILLWQARSEESAADLKEIASRKLGAREV
jgi:lipopolysaccharide/colanic/teichoic acid biosynthesis glycosyltransferase